jgi:hypothetical protein
MDLYCDASFVSVRFYKLLNTGLCEVISFTVPRKVRRSERTAALLNVSFISRPISFKRISIKIQLARISLSLLMSGSTAPMHHRKWSVHRLRSSKSLIAAFRLHFEIFTLLRNHRAMLPLLPCCRLQGKRTTINQDAVQWHYALHNLFVCHLRNPSVFIKAFVSPYPVDLSIHSLLFRSRMVPSSSQMLRRTNNSMI